MANVIRYVLGCLAWLSASGVAHAADLSALNKDMSYREVKTWHERFLQGAPSVADRTEALRLIVRTSQFGERGLTRIYGDFEGVRSIDPRIPGVEKTVLLQRSASSAQVKGYRRELLYGIEFHNDARFRLVEMNRPLKDTDADLIFCHKATGLYGRAEVKDVSLDSQKTNMRNLKVQMDKMAGEGRRTGQFQVWLSRRVVHPDLRNYAIGKGILVLGEVKTGRFPTGNEISSKDALDAIDRKMVRTSQGRAIAGGIALAYGASMLINTAPGALDATRTVWDAETRTAAAWRKLGEQGSYLVAGSGMVASGGAILASGYASEALQARLLSMGMFGGLASVAAMGVGETFLVSRYLYGDVSSREFWTSQFMLGSTLASASAGSWFGSAIGGWWGGPVSMAFGSVLGGAAGTWLGQYIGASGASYYYEWRFAKLDEDFGRFVYDRYGVR